jgi:mycofactocin system glycosyltransferase
VPPEDAADLVPDRVVVDPSVRTTRGGETLIGGSPLRILRLSRAGARAFDQLAAGRRVPAAAGVRRLVRRLLDAGMVHPHPQAGPTAPGPVPAPGDVAAVVPVRDDAPGAARAVASLLAEGVTEVVVVDDGSVEPAGLDAALPADRRVRVVRHVVAAGPGAARDAGWRACSAAVVVFCDADTTGAPGWLATVLRHLADPLVGAVAPRVVAEPSGGGELGGPLSSVLDRYEARRSPLDLGPEPARVRPGTRVAYVPAAALVARRAALEEVRGFDPGLRYGEDVDLVWRFDRAGWSVRYEPAALTHHRNRAGWLGLARQRASYGSAAAPLDRRHPGQVAPVELNRWTVAAWSLAVLGGRWGRRAGVAVAVGSTVALAPKLRGTVDDPLAEAARLGGLGHLWAGRWLATATRRAWLPIALAVALLWRPARGPVAAAVVGAPLAGWLVERPPVGPVRWVAASLLDDAAYCAGLWRGCRAERSWRALAPRVLSTHPAQD